MRELTDDRIREICQSVAEEVMRLKDRQVIASSTLDYMWHACKVVLYEAAQETLTELDPVKHN